ncbi:LysR family transcriptional regulator [Sphaerisporangium sp. NPDC049002]|uniref:LysR family transcriptional regulator n=1 Tax=unclassified Sphaerisporangium TaxID=2630420 RepID=UPI0033F52307
MLDVRRLALLREFARRGSIAATAASLGYSASAVSQQLAALERETGSVLLDRTSRSAELTDAGHRLVEHAERILAMVEAAESDLSAHAATPSGRVVVTAFPTGAVAFAPVLARSLRRHTSLSLRLRQSRSGRGMREVQAGEVDIALVDDWYGSLRARDTEALRVMPLLVDPLVLVVPRRHRMADPSVPVDLWALRDEPWMATPDGEPSRMAVDRLLSDVGGAHPVPWEFEGLGTILSLVAKGIGIAAVPALALAAGVRGVAVREFPGDPVTREVQAVVRASSVNRPSVAATLRALHVAARYLAADLAPVRSSAE